MDFVQTGVPLDASLNPMGFATLNPMDFAAFNLPQGEREKIDIL